MGPNEFNTTKNVTIDEDGNIVKEFLKTQKIDRGTPKKAEQEKKKAQENKDSEKANTEPKGKKAKKQKQKDKKDA